MREKLFPVTLNCGHIVFHKLLPREGDTVGCFECKQAAIVQRVHKYTARCTVCAYRNHEGDLTNASTRARRHADHTGHPVKLIYPSTPRPVVLLPHHHVIPLGMTA